MKHRKLAVCLAILIAIVLIVPMKAELDDGGTVEYTAFLWRLEKRHQMWREAMTMGI